MPNKEQHILTESLKTSKDQLDKVMTTGKYGDWKTLTTQRLSEPFMYRSEMYKWVTMGRFLTDHKESTPITHGLVEFRPLLGIKLQTEQDQSFGFVTDITYAPFSLSAPFLTGDKPPISSLLRPISFDIYIGEGDVEDAETVLLRDGQLDTPDELSEVAHAAGHSIVAAADVLRSHTLEQIDEAWYKL